MSMRMPAGVRRGVSSLSGFVTLVVLLSMAVLPAWAQHGVNWTRDLSKALTDAKAAKKLVVIDVYTDW